MNHPRPTIERLRSGHRADPLGVPLRPIPLTWTPAGDADIDRDAGFEVIVGASAEAVAQDDASCWRASGLPTARVVYDEPLPARTRRYWRVAATAGGDRVESAIASFETGIAAEDWTADWIAAPLNPFRRQTWDPAPLLRTVIEVDSAESARAYVTALGIYRLWINGEEVTADELLRPGWTDYAVRVYHQTYDVTPFLRPGRNAIGIELAKGWYAGRVGLQREPGLYGEQPAARFQLEVDGAVHGSDASWRCGYGAVQVSDMLLGETQDVRRTPAGWTLPDFDDSAWAAVETLGVDVLVEPQPHDSPGFHRVHPGTVVHQHGRGPVVFDFGQNLVGWTRVRTRTLPKADLMVRHGEILTPSNLVYRDNLRSAFQEDVYFTGDAEVHDLEPRFTVHGFRYAEVWGLPSVDPFGIYELTPETSIEAVSIDAGMEQVGSFECSDPRLNAVADAIEWTVRDNFLEVITDCPQREERLGWLGDAGVIGPTSAYYFDVAAFVSKFVQDAEDTQGADGTIRSYAPAVPPGDRRDGAPGWADGYVRLVHLLAERYGDLAAARRHYASMRRYLDFVDAQNPSGIRTEAVGADFGDWLSLPDDPDEPAHPGYEWTGARSTTPRPVHDTAHTYRSYTQLAALADWLGESEEAQRCRARAAEIGAAYRDAFVAADGSITGDTQTAYAQALGYGLLDGTDVRPLALERFVEKVAAQGYVTTGIHGVEHILPVLARNGHADLAYQILLREDMPGWLHMIAMGATTIWEKWDGLRLDGTMSTAEMNSMNHCALGAIGRFLFEDVAGIDATTTAWSGVVRVAPQYTRSLEWARASYASPSGLVTVRWRWEGDSIVQEVTVPPGITAEVHVPEGFSCDSATELGPGAHSLVLLGGAE